MRKDNSKSLDELFVFLLFSFILFFLISLRVIFDVMMLHFRARLVNVGALHLLVIHIVEAIEVVPEGAGSNTHPIEAIVIALVIEVAIIDEIVI